MELLFTASIPHPVYTGPAMQPTRRDFLAATGGLTALAACQTTPGPRTTDRPNFLFFFPDQHRSDWVEWNSSVPVPTPNLSALRNRGVSFSNAVVDSPVCGPSRACLASGRRYERCGVIDNGQNYPMEQGSYYKSLRESGYHVMGCGKLDLRKVDRAWGVDGKGSMEPLGFSDMIDNAGKNAGGASFRRAPLGPKDPYFAYLESLDPPLGEVWAKELDRLGVVKWNNLIAREDKTGLDELLAKETWWGETKPVALPDEAYCDNWIARNGLELLDRAPEDKPWHLVINFVGPHPPMDITVNMEQRYRGPDRVIDNFEQPNNYSGPFPAEQHIRIRQNYAAMIENIDRWLGVYVEKLKERGELDNTIIVYSSDHGEMLGDHSLWSKTYPFHSSAGVPLVAAGPGIRQGFDSDAQASLIDLTATFMDYGEAGELEHQDGQSLRPILENVNDRHREYSRSSLTISSGVWRFAQDHRYKLVEGYGEPRLYDREADPFENQNLFDSKPGEVERLSKLFT